MSLRNVVQFVLEYVTWWHARVGGVGDVLGWVTWEYGWHGSRANVGGMLFLLLLLLLKYYLEEKIVECLLLKQWKNVPNRSEKWFIRRSWFEERVLLWIMPGSWTCLILEHVYMRSRVKSRVNWNQFEISNRFKMSFCLHGFYMEISLRQLSKQ